MNKLILIAPLIGITIGTESCKHNNTGMNPANISIPVNVTEVKQEKVAFYDSYPATVIAMKEVEIRSEVNGYVTGIFFNDAQPVSKGTKLYEIDRIKYQASYQEAKNNVDIAEANFERAKRDADRYTELSKQDAIAKQRFDDAMTDLNNVKLQVTSAKAELTKAETDLNYSIVKAPFDGTIGISMVKLGSLINAGQTLLNVVSSDDPIGVDIVIDEKELGLFQKLQNKPGVISDSTMRILLPDNTIYKEPGKISLIDRAVDPQTGTIKVRFIFPNQNRTLKSGMNCDMQVLDESAGLQLVIPYKAVVEQMGEYFVFVSDGKQVKQTKVTLGTKLDSKVIVLQGLKQSDEVVTEGVQKLRDGSSILVGIPETAKNTNPSK